MKTLLVALTLCYSCPITCEPHNEDEDAKASACRLSGGQPYVQEWANCTTKRGSCKWRRKYKGCYRR